MNENQETKPDLVQVFRGELESLIGLQNKALQHMANQELDSVTSAIHASKKHIGAMLAMLPGSTPEPVDPTNE